MIESIANFISENVAVFGIAVAGFVALVGLLLFFGWLASKSEKTNTPLLRLLDAFTYALTFWIPIVGPRIHHRVTKQIYTTPKQRSKP